MVDRFEPNQALALRIKIMLFQEITLYHLLATFYFRTHYFEITQSNLVRLHYLLPEIKPLLPSAIESFRKDFKC